MAVTGDVDSAMRRDTAGTAIGNFMEWYDFGVYGYIATTIAQVFYPGNSVSAVHLIATFSTLAAVYVVRPLGGFVLGPLGDRIGRKRVLLITIVLMAVGTTMSGLLPGYSTIGIWAPILLLVARIFQGLSTGGEFVGAMTYLVERAPDHKRGKMVGFLPLGNLVGFVFAGLLVTSLQASLPAHDMLAWGWRIPLLLGAPFGVLALWLRLRIEESPDYEQVIGNADEPTDLGWKQFRRTVADRPDIGNLDGHGGVVAMLSDRIGVKPIMWTGCILLVVASVPAFLLMRFASALPLVFLGVLLVGLMELCFDSTTPSALPALFPTKVRNGALAISYNIALSVVGGATPLIAQVLTSSTGNPIAPAYMLIGAGLVGIVTLRFMPEVAGKPLPGSGSPGECIAGEPAGR